MKKKYVIAGLIIIGVVILLGLVFILSVRQVSKIYLYVDQIEGGNLVFDPYEGDDLQLEVGQEATLSLSYDPEMKLVFTNCEYDKKIIEYKNKIITAKAKGETKLVCSVVFNNKVKSEPIKIKVS